jgi:penicillin amidase
VIEHIQHPEKYYPTPVKESRDQFLKKCFEQAYKKMALKFLIPPNGVDTRTWQYGQLKYKHIQFEHPLSAFTDSATRKKINLQAYPRGGNGYTVGSTGSTENQQSGASFRVLMDTKDWDKTLMINTPGQSGDPNSPFYGNLLEKWATDGYFPANFSKSLIEKNMDNTIMIIPKIMNKKN